VARWAAATPQVVALEHVDGRTLTYAELHRDALRWAAGLDRLGVVAGDHVATMVHNDFDSQRALLGLGWLRAVEVPLNTAFTGRILAYALDHADVTTLIVAPAFVERVVDVLADVPKLRTVVVLGDAATFTADLFAPSVRVVARDALLDVDPIDPSPPGPEYHDVHSLMFTSGTTGPSKAVITPWPVMYQFWSWVPEDTVAPGDGVYCTMPMFHNSGRSAFNYVMVRGGRFVIRDRFSATEFWADVRATSVTTAALVGPMTAVLYAAERSAHDADNPLRNVVLGPMIPEIADFEARFGVRTCTCYGQTEVGIPVATGWDHGPWANCGRQRADYPWPEVRVVDEHDEPLGAGEVGELVVRSPEPWSLNVGYYKMPEQTVDAWRNGWFHTGDAFRYDDDGWYYFVDRLRDSIRRRGENISSFEVEAAVSEYDDVLECAAIGVPAEHGDDDVMVAVIVRDASAFDPAAMLSFLEPRMPRFMLPRYVEVVEDLPRTEASMRVRKHELRSSGVTAATWDREHPREETS
jgi:crotonobetaine/carnitine-CoA ligase